MEQERREFRSDRELVPASEGLHRPPDRPWDHRVDLYAADLLENCPARFRGMRSDGGFSKGVAHAFQALVHAPIFNLLLLQADQFNLKEGEFRPSNKLPAPINRSRRGLS